MNSNLHKFEKGQRRLIPAFVIVCFAFLNVTTLPLLHEVPFSFGLTESAIFYWTLLQPMLVPYWLLFLVGMMTDAVNGGAFGLHAVAFMLMRLLTARVRPFVPRHNLPLCVLAFAVVYAVVCGVSLLLTSFLTTSIVIATPILAGWTATVGIYPVLALLFHRVFRAITARRN